MLREAYRIQNASVAANAYTDDAIIEYAYGSDRTRHVGREDIEASFSDFFSQIGTQEQIDLNFRIESSAPEGENLRDRGVYRLRFASGAASYGYFEVERVIQNGASAMFTFDRATDATRDAFEALPGPVLFDADSEQLDPAYYRRLTGRYQRPDGCDIIVTQSAYRLFVRDGCTEVWQGLNRVSGLEWTGGETVLSSNVTTTLKFDEPTTSDSQTLTMTQNGQTVSAKRNTAYTKDEISFQSSDDTSLSGLIYRPVEPSTKASVVLIHGSGPQDRNGYASIIAVIADEFAANGHAVIVFDKRGTGSSEGDWSRAGFDRLAEDVIAAEKALLADEALSDRPVIYAGSSQAGWVAATAIERGGQAKQIVLLGAAGAAISVREQNIYNTRIRMGCSGIDETSIDLALRQQNAFFDFVANPAMSDTLQAVTEQASADETIRDWLFPDAESVDLDGDNWFTTLSLEFDPITVWADYSGQMTFIFSEHDDSTPTDRAISRLKDTIGEDNLQTVLLDGAQHLGLLASGPCDASLSTVSRFHPDLFRALTDD